MNFLRHLFCPSSSTETRTDDLHNHDAIISDLRQELHRLQQVQYDPLSARVRGIYPERRVREVRINPRSRDHHG